MNPQQEHEFGKLVRYLQHRRIEAVAIEAGHIYVDEMPGDKHLRSFVVGAEVLSALVAHGIRPMPIVFIDNYNPPTNGLCLRSYLSLARGSGFFQPHCEPEGLIFWEADMVSGAEEILANLRGQHLVQEGPNGELLTAGHGNIMLRKADGKLSCALLDAAFCLHRFNQFPYHLTVLPKKDEHYDYKHQQRNVRKLLRLLGWDDIPVANVFFQSETDWIVVRSEPTLRPQNL